MLKSININPDLHKQLKIFSVEHGITIKEIVENLIRELLLKWKKK